VESRPEAAFSFGMPGLAATKSGASVLTQVKQAQIEGNYRHE
jgi:hypothetical protein